MNFFKKHKGHFVLGLILVYFGATVALKVTGYIGLNVFSLIFGVPMLVLMFLLIAEDYKEQAHVEAKLAAKKMIDRKYLPWNIKF